MIVKLDNDTLRSDIIYSSNLFKNTIPKIISNKITKDDLYTFMIIDKDAPYPENPIYKYYVHLLVVNCKETVIEYNRPNPPQNSNPHKYFVYVYKQQEKINVDNISYKNFDLDAFVSKHNLKKVDEFNVMVKNN